MKNELVRNLETSTSLPNWKGGLFLLQKSGNGF